MDIHPITSSAVAQTQSLNNARGPSLTAAACGITSLDHDINAHVKDRVNSYLQLMAKCRGTLNDAKQENLGVLKEKSFDDIERLSSLRERTFSYVNKDSDLVFGRLNVGKSDQDIKEYIEQLVEFAQVRKSVQNVENEMGFIPIEILRLHHSNYLFGDIKALEDGRPIPDFRYNSGSLQFG